MGGGSFYIKNKLESEIFNNKKSLSVTTKNLIWEIRVGGGGGLTKKQLSRKGAWTVCRFKGGLVKKRGWCF